MGEGCQILKELFPLPLLLRTLSTHAPNFVSIFSIEMACSNRSGLECTLFAYASYTHKLEKFVGKRHGGITRSNVVFGERLFCHGM